MGKGGNCSRSFKIEIFSDEIAMGKAAAQEAGETLRYYTAQKGREVMTIFAAAPSQDTFLSALSQEEGIDWSKVNAFHLDEYLDLPKKHPNTFEKYLEEHIFSKVPIPRERIYYFKDIVGSPQEIATRYEKLLKEVFLKTQRANSIYLAFIGIGVNGHIAFNEPGTDLWTKDWVVKVKIDEISVGQQFGDYKNHPNSAARYKSLEEVPRNALTVTCAGVLAADVIFCMVPGEHKAVAVKSLLEGPITDTLPASLLRLHGDVHLYLDNASASKLHSKPAVNK